MNKYIVMVKTFDGDYEYYGGDDLNDTLERIANESKNKMVFSITLFPHNNQEVKKNENIN